MSDIVFRAQTPPGPAPEPMKAPADKGVPRGTTEIEPPFTDYESQKGKPYLVDYYELGSMWNRNDMYTHGYNDDVSTVNQYLNHMINQGEVNNTLDSVKGELKRLEKMLNVKNDARKSMRLALVAEYAKFLLKSENIKKESARFRLI